MWNLEGEKRKNPPFHLNLPDSMHLKWWGKMRMKCELSLLVISLPWHDRRNCLSFLIIPMRNETVILVRERCAVHHYDCLTFPPFPPLHVISIWSGYSSKLTDSSSICFLVHSRFQRRWLTRVKGQLFAQTSEYECICVISFSLSLKVHIEM